MSRKRPIEDAAGDWITDPPPIGVALELVTAAGDTLTGEVSFIAAHDVGEGRRVSQFMLRGGSRRIFEVVRWRRVAA